MHIAHRIPFQESIDRSGQLMRSDGQGFALALLILPASELFLPPRLVPQQPDGSLREGPGERGVTHRRPRGPGAFARRRLGTCDEATGGDAILDAGEARDVRNRVEQDQTPNCAQARHRLEPLEALRLVLLCCLEARQRKGAEQPILVVHESAVDCHPFLHGRLREPLGHPIAVGFIGDLLTDLRQGIRAVGILDRREQRGPFPCERQATPHESTGRAPPGRLDIRLRQQAAPP